MTHGFDLADRRALGLTDLHVAPVAFGTSPLGGVFGTHDVDATRLLAEVIDLGINLIDTAPYYGDAETILGEALQGRRDEILLSTKAGRYPSEIFDHRPARIRSSLHESLTALRTDHVDLFQLHDIEYVPLTPIFEDAYAELLALRDEGLCRYVGMTAYPIATLEAAIMTVDLDVVLCYAHATLLDDSIAELLPLASRHGVGVINAAAVALGLLTPGGSSLHTGHPATDAVREAAARMREECERLGIDLPFLANQYSIQRCGSITTVVGSRRIGHIASAVEAALTPIDEGALQVVLAFRPAAPRAWRIGLDENNG